MSEATQWTEETCASFIRDGSRCANPHLKNHVCCSRHKSKIKDDTKIYNIDCTETKTTCDKTTLEILKDTVASSAKVLEALTFSNRLFSRNQESEEKEEKQVPQNEEEEEMAIRANEKSLKITWNYFEADGAESEQFDVALSFQWFVVGITSHSKSKLKEDTDPAALKTLLPSWGNKKTWSEKIAPLLPEWVSHFLTKHRKTLGSPHPKINIESSFSDDEERFLGSDVSLVVNGSFYNRSDMAQFLFDAMQFPEFNTCDVELSWASEPYAANFPRKQDYTAAKQSFTKADEIVRIFLQAFRDLRRSEIQQHRYQIYVLQTSRFDDLLGAKHEPHMEVFESKFTVMVIPLWKPVPLSIDNQKWIQQHVGKWGYKVFSDPEAVGEIERIAGTMGDNKGTSDNSAQCSALACSIWTQICQDFVRAENMANSLYMDLNQYPLTKGQHQAALKRFKNQNHANYSLIMQIFKKMETCLKMRVPKSFLERRESWNWDHNFLGVSKHSLDTSSRSTAQISEWKDEYQIHRNKAVKTQRTQNKQEEEFVEQLLDVYDKHRPLFFKPIGLDSSGDTYILILNNAKQGYLGHIYVFDINYENTLGCIGIRTSGINAACQQVRKIGETIITAVGQFAKSREYSQVGVTEPIGIMPQILLKMGFIPNFNKVYLRNVKEMQDNRDIHLLPYCLFPYKRLFEDLDAAKKLRKQYAAFLARKWSTVNEQVPKIDVDKYLIQYFRLQPDLLLSLPEKLSFDNWKKQRE